MLIDRGLIDLPGAAFALALDNCGFALTPNTKFSRPLNGQREHDLVHWGNKWIFDAPMGIRLAKDREPYLLQAHLRCAMRAR